MVEYIAKNLAIELMHQSSYLSDGDLLEVNGNLAKARIEAEPAADLVPVVHAYWIPQKENHEFKEVWMKCSVCGYPVSRWTGNTNFCPSCGAKMDAQGEE